MIARYSTHVVFRRHIVTLPLPYLHQRRVIAGGNGTPLSSRESLRKTRSENVLASDANGPSAAAKGAPCGKLSFVARRAETFQSSFLFGAVTMPRLLLSPRRATSLRAFYFCPFVPGSSSRNESAKKSRSRWSSTESNRSPHAFLSAECANCSVYTNR